MRRARIGSLLVFVATVATVLAGPDWPTRTTDLSCGETYETLEIRATFEDMDACTAEMVMGCGCGVRSDWDGPIVYLTFLPLGMLASVWMTSRDAGRGMATVLGVLGFALLIPVAIVQMYSTGLRFPGIGRLGQTINQLLQTFAFGLPQLVFFGPSLYGAESQSGPVIPHEWSYVSTVIFWIAISVIFGVFTKRVERFRRLLSLSLVLVLAIAIAVPFVVPAFGWKLLAGP